MSNDLVRRTDGSGKLQKFDPKKAKSVIETLKQAVVYSHRMRQWDEGMEAAELIVQWEREFVGWWDRKVGVRKSAGNQTTGRVNADLRSLTSRAVAEAETEIKQQQVSRMRNGLKRPDYAARIFSIGHKKAMADSAQRRADLQTGEMEWFTPSIYIEKARRVLGQFDLDPATCAAAQEVVNARHFFTAKDDGLAQDWQGAVWLNPPYAGKLVAAFARKMLEQIACGNVTAAIMLTNAYTETSWFHNLASGCSAICLTRGRIKFISPQGEKCAPTNGQSFFYFGADRKRFIAEFNDVGMVLVRP
jgi:phage N-6-adenine-methyltransferase